MQNSFNFSNSDFNLLNDEEASNIKGGKKKCTGAGDTILTLCALVVDYTVKWCITKEASCGSGFSFDDDGNMTCQKDFSLTDA
ncbi:MAG: hypothetical protein N4A72_23035 [Bacteroidales bacterium]|jgi:hypothetical protein|nr:hypothetical protein [Bacteroidales bacterium]